MWNAHLGRIYVLVFFGAKITESASTHIIIVLSWGLILGITPIQIIKKLHLQENNILRINWLKLVFVQLNMFFGVIAGSAYGIALAGTFFAYIFIIIHKLHLMTINSTVLACLILAVAFFIAAFSSYWYCEGSILYLVRKLKK